MSEFTLLNFSPFVANVMDYIDKPLITKDGRLVRVEKLMSGSKFLIYVQGQDATIVDGNIATSNFLNRIEVGIER